MSKKTLSTVALVTGLFGVVIGVWGLVDRMDGADVAAIEEGFMWVAIGILTLAISATCLALAARDR